MMKKRLFAALMCLIMVLTLLPVTAFATNATSVWIAGAELTNTTPYYHNGGTEANNSEPDYNAYFDAANGTLTLKGLNVANSEATKEIDIRNITYAIYAEGNLTICVDGENNISVKRIGGTTNANAYALYVNGSLTVKPVESGSGTLTAVSNGAGISSGDASCCGVDAGRLEVNSGATLTGKVSDGVSSGNSQASCYGVYAGNITVNGGTLKGEITGTATGLTSASSCGVFAPGSGSISVTGGEFTATGGNATGEESFSYGVFAPSVSVTGGEFTATSGSAAVNSYGVYASGVSVTGGEFTATGGSATTSSYGVDTEGSISVSGGEFTAITLSETETHAALIKSLSLDAGVAAQGSTASGGGSSVDYVEADNGTYKWVHAGKSSLTVTASPSGSVSMGTAVTLTATPANITVETYQWFSNAVASGEGANDVEDATAATYTPPTVTAGTIYYFCKANNEIVSNIVGVTVAQPTSHSGGDGDDYTPSPVTLYNDSSRSDATVWIAGNGLNSSDSLITERNPQGSAYQALMNLANSGDIIATYDVRLNSGKKNSSSAMSLTFDLNSRYAREAFTLVHQKANGTYEYFYDTADQSGALTFGPLYELSPFMLVKGKLEPTSAIYEGNPDTGYNAQSMLWLCPALVVGAALAASNLLGRKKRHNG